jgi:predicted DsbA family dithiol-disulfide isomerase
LETLDLVREAVKDCGCKVVEKSCADVVCCDEAKRYGVRSVPTIVADGVILFEGKPPREQAIALLRR